MGNPNQRLVTILGVGWLAFIGLGFGLRQMLSGPAVTVVIDRSYCDPSQWPRVTQAYANLYDQQQQRQLTIDQVIYVSDLGQEVATTIPTPDQVSGLNTFGRFSAEQLQQVSQAYPNARVLTCRGGNP
ncbi:MAG: hypothetical protein EA342_18005 [Leptolyngbya sp. LCM1.Bin17]|nr:MAG: hypothetical protein EA342_18005 [Leptolyngbya sp. LCM1.Bin17]